MVYFPCVPVKRKIMIWILEFMIILYLWQIAVPTTTGMVVWSVTRVIWKSLTLSLKITFKLGKSRITHFDFTWKHLASIDEQVRYMHFLLHLVPSSWPWQLPPSGITTEWSTGPRRPCIEDATLRQNTRVTIIFSTGLYSFSDETEY